MVGVSFRPPLLGLPLPAGCRPDDPRLNGVYRHFRANLSDICRAATRRGAKTFLFQQNDQNPKQGNQPCDTSAQRQYFLLKTEDIHVGDEKAGSKLARAPQLGVSVRDEDQFEALLWD
jgi:hypothetical protein